MSNPDSSERVRIRSEEYDLQRRKTEDKEVRIIRWAVFVSGFLIFWYSFLGSTIWEWRGAGQILTILLSALVGMAVKNPFAALFRKAT